MTTTLSFDEYARLEPALAGLAATLKAINGDGPNFCGNAVWYGYAAGFETVLSFKDRVTNLVGWRRKLPGPPALKSAECYDLVYDFLFNLLPPCRACSCMVPLHF